MKAQSIMLIVFRLGFFLGRLLVAGGLVDAKWDAPIPE
jgi:hypothetical protein